MLTLSISKGVRSYPILLRIVSLPALIYVALSQVVFSRRLATLHCPCARYMYRLDGSTSIKSSLWIHSSVDKFAKAAKTTASSVPAGFSNALIIESIVLNNWELNSSAAASASFSCTSLYLSLASLLSFLGPRFFALRCSFLAAFFLTFSAILSASISFFSVLISLKRQSPSTRGIFLRRRSFMAAEHSAHDAGGTFWGLVSGRNGRPGTGSQL